MNRIASLAFAALLSAPLAAWAIGFNAPVEKLAGDFQFTEGPIWLAAKNELLFSDIPANRIVRYKDGKFTTFRTPSQQLQRPDPRQARPLDRLRTWPAPRHPYRGRQHDHRPRRTLRRPASQSARTTWSSRATAPSTSPTRPTACDAKSGNWTSKASTGFARRQDADRRRPRYSTNPTGWRSRPTKRPSTSTTPSRPHPPSTSPPTARSATAASSPGRPAPTA